MSEFTERLQAALPERYTIERTLGRGAMGTVFLATESQPQRQVAIKVLNPTVTARIGRERFVREVNFASNLTHPHVVPIFAAGEAEDFLYYVMPYVSGETVRQRVAREFRLPLWTALGIAAEVADALAYAHRKGIIHRDVKPENILLQDDHALVTDFGIARAISAAESESLTETGIALGTPAYMSPEQVGADETIDGRTDTYALGCVLYEMLDGTPPFDRSPARVVMRRQIMDPVPSLRETQPTIPIAVEYAIRKALAKAPEDRHSSAADFARILSDLRAQISSGAMPIPSLAEITAAQRKVDRRIPFGIAAGLIVLLVALWQLVLPHGNSAALASGRFIDSVAVLPIQNLTGDSALDYVADAVTYDVVHELSRIERLKVTSLQSVRALTQANLRPTQLGDSLEVRLILTSSFRRAGDQVRIGAELVDATSDNSVWTERWDLNPADEESFEQTVVQRLVGGIVTTVDGLETAPGEPGLMHGPAYETYMRGTESLGLRTPSGVNTAIARFHEAVSIDASYAPAYAALSSAYTLALVYRYEIGLGGYEAAGLALAAASRAIELDPHLAQGYAARGLLASRALGPNDQAAADFRRALELQPSAPEQPSWFATILVQEGRNEQALTAAERGVSLNPYSPARHLAYALVALELRRYDVALFEARRVTALEPEITVSRALEGRVLLLSGRLDECLAVELGPHDGVRAACLHELGRVTEATAIIDSIIQVVEGGAVPDPRYTDVTRLDDLACYYAWTGDTRRAVQWLRRAYDSSPMGIDMRTLRSDLFTKVRADPQAARDVDLITSGVWGRVREHSERTPLP